MKVTSSTIACLLQARAGEQSRDAPHAAAAMPVVRAE
jgi:hypothetical protein